MSMTKIYDERKVHNDLRRVWRYQKGYQNP